MPFEVDYSQRTSFPLLDEGEHDAVIHSMKLTQGPQANYLRTRFSIKGDELNRQAWMNISLADGALWRITKMARDLGLASRKRTYASRDEFEQEVIKMFTGRDCTITVENEKFEGVVRNRVANVGAPAAG